MYEIYEKLCKLKDVTSYRVSKATGIATATLSDWKKGKPSPKADKLEILAAYFGVTPDFIRGRTSVVTCKTCHQTYDPLNEYQASDHEKYHSLYIDATKKYGDLLPYGDAADLRDKAVRDFRNPRLSLSEREGAFDTGMRYGYMMEIYSSRFAYPLSFEDYCRDEAEKLTPDHSIPLPLCNNIRKKYGVSEVVLDETQSDLLRFDNVRPVTVQTIPVLGQVACGTPKFMEEHYELYTSVGLEVRADFLLIAKGDSMIGARINDGDLVFIRQQDMVENGEIAAVAIADEATLKRFYRYEPDLVVLRAENPQYEDLEFRGEELQNVRVLGKAVAFQSRII